MGSSVAAVIVGKLAVGIDKMPVSLPVARMGVSDVLAGLVDVWALEGIEFLLEAEV